MTEPPLGIPLPKKIASLIWREANSFANRSHYSEYFSRFIPIYYGSFSCQAEISLM